MLWNDVPIYEKQIIIDQILDNNGEIIEEEHTEFVQIESPSDRDYWFYFIENNQSHYLLEMLNEGFHVNTINTDGETLLNLAFLYSHHNLIDLALQFDADIFHTDRSEEHALYVSCYPNISLDSFIAIWEHSPDLNPLLCRNVSDTTAIEVLFNNEPSLSKLRWLAEHYNNFFEFVQDKHLISLAQDLGKSHIVYFLKGKEKLLKKLTEHYDIDNSHELFEEQAVKI
jgi:hypothetical protein